MNLEQTKTWDEIRRARNDGGKIITATTFPLNKKLDSMIVFEAIGYSEVCHSYEESYENPEIWVMHEGKKIPVKIVHILYIELKFSRN